MQRALIIGLLIAALPLVQACGIRPASLKPPSGATAEKDTFPRQYPAPSTGKF